MSLRGVLIMRGIVLIGLILQPTLAYSQTSIRKTHYLVSYFGIPVLDCYETFQQNDSLTTVLYDNQIKPFWAQFHPVHNEYGATFQTRDYTPLASDKRILESGFRQNLTTIYNQKLSRIEFRDAQTSLPLEPGVRSVFAAVHWLEHKFKSLQYPFTLPIQIEGKFLTAQVTNQGAEQITMAGQATWTNHLKITLEYDHGQAIWSRTDVLMDFLGTDGSTLELWLDNTPRVVQAKVGKFPGAVLLTVVKNDAYVAQTD